MAMKRAEVAEELKWNLNNIYSNENAYLSDLAQVKDLYNGLLTYKNKLTDKDIIIDCLKKYEQYLIIADHLYQYRSLATSVDIFDSNAQRELNNIDFLLATFNSELAFIESELIILSDNLLEEVAAQYKPAAHYLSEILRNKKHYLNAQTEAVLTKLSSAFHVPYDLYETAKLADMSFPDFTVDGKAYPLSYSLFEDNYEYEENTAIRRKAYETFHNILNKYKNITAQCYNDYLQNEKKLAEVRNYRDAFDMNLYKDNVSLEMYNRQIDLITELLAPAMRRYAKLIQKIHHLDEMTFADLKLPVDSGYNPFYSIADTKDILLNALAIYGQEYRAMVKEAFEKHWIDFAQNEGKETGGFCASPYRKGSFILLSWHNRMSDVFTLAHELGHAGHFRLCGLQQSYFDAYDVASYIVEAPSTMNELLLGKYLLENNNDKRFKRYVLSNIISNTYYHNFVTHLREAWYQREAMKIVGDGGIVDSDTLSNIFKENLNLFWGDAVKLDNNAYLTWMRQPHYYMGLYSYTYSAGLTLATSALQNINHDSQAIENWKDMLKAGNTLDPIQLASLAKVDITSDKPLRNTIKYISDMIEEVIQLSEEIDNIKIA